MVLVSVWFSSQEMQQQQLNDFDLNALMRKKFRVSIATVEPSD